MLLNARPARKIDAIVAIAGSTGAMPALERFAPTLGALDVAVLVVQHLPPERMGTFAEWLSAAGLVARVAEQALPLTRGEAVVAPGHHHLVVRPGQRAELDGSPAVAGHRPSADLLFRSLVPVAPLTLAVVLSGMGSDGATGLAPLVAAGARCIVQRADTCPVSAMPMAAQEAAKGQARALAPSEIGAAIRSWLAERRSGRVPPTGPSPQQALTHRSS